MITVQEISSDVNVLRPYEKHVNGTQFYFIFLRRCKSLNNSKGDVLKI